MVVLKGLVLYDTGYGNTKRVAEEIAEALRERGHEVEVHDIEEVRELSAAGYGFVVIGSPTKIGSMSLAMRRFLRRFKGEEWMGKPFFTFDTELEDVIRKSGSSAAEKIQKELEEKGLKPLIPPFKAAVVGMKGPLAPDAVEKAKEHAIRFAEKLG